MREMQFDVSSTVFLISVTDSTSRMRHHGGPRMQVDGLRKQAGSLRETRADRSFRERVPGKARLQQTSRPRGSECK